MMALRALRTTPQPTETEPLMILRRKKLTGCQLLTGVSYASGLGIYAAVGGASQDSEHTRRVLTHSEEFSEGLIRVGRDVKVSSVCLFSRFGPDSVVVGGRSWPRCDVDLCSVR